MDNEQEDGVTELLQFLYACPVGLLEFSQNGEITLINPRAMQLLLLLAADGFASNFYGLIETYAPELRNMVDSFSSNQGTICENHHILVKPGSKQSGKEAKVLACTIVRLTTDRLIASLADVSKQVDQAKRLSQAETWFASMLDNINDFATLSVNESGIILSITESVLRQTGFDGSETIGLSLETFAVQTQNAPTMSVIGQIESAKQQGWYLSEGWSKKKSGAPYWSQRLISMRGDTSPGDIQADTFTVVIRDVTRHELDTTKLLRMLRKDYLTGAWNRAHFFEAGEMECMRAERCGLNLSLIAIDIDHFKTINDTYGHAAGDAVLVAFSQTCLTLLRANDLFARVGGEEFVVLLPSTNIEKAAQTAQRLCFALAAMKVAAGGQTISLTASFGCVQMQPQASTLSAMLDAADVLLYRAKNAGRNRVEAGLMLDRA